MSKTTKLILSALLIGTFGMASPALADWCMQLGSPFSGDDGFFRFKGKLPKKAGKIKTLKGRVAGISPVYGTATVYKDGSGVEIGASFFVDAFFDHLNITFFGPNFTTGTGEAYGQSVDATIVKCSGEPGD